MDKFIIDKIKDVNIDSIYIEENNKLSKIKESKELHELRSCSKILVSMAIGIAIDKKYKINNEVLDLKTKVYPIISSLTNIKSENNKEKMKKWTIKNLLTHTTGYDCQMFSNNFIKDIDKEKLIDYALNYEIKNEVGEKFVYNNLEPFILSIFFQNAFNQNLSEFINDNIFKKLDINEYEWKNYGKYCPGGTGLYLKHEDFHKIGKLLLDDGKYNGLQIIPKNWIKEMCSMQIETPNEYKQDRIFPKVGAGYFTFISRDDFVFRDGSNGQYLIINKNKKILISIMSTEKDMKKVTEIFRKIL